MRGEETSGRLEPLLAAAFSRRAWTAAYVAVAMAGSALVLAANGLGAGLADALNSHDAGQLPRLLAAAVAPAPAVWVVVGAAVALFGLVPRAAAAAWGVLGACVALSVLGPLLGLPELGARPVSVRPRSSAARGGLQRGAAGLAVRDRRGADRARDAGLPPPRPRALGRRPHRPARLAAAHVGHVAGEQELGLLAPRGGVLRGREWGSLPSCGAMFGAAPRPLPRCPSRRSPSPRTGCA